MLKRKVKSKQGCNIEENKKLKRNEIKLNIDEKHQKYGQRRKYKSEFYRENKRKKYKPKKTNNMKTANTTEENTMTETTFELPIPKMAAGHTIEALEKCDIKCDYIGVDEKGNIVMKVSYFDWQKEKLIEIIEEMNLTDFSLNLLLTIGGVTSLIAYLKNKEMQSKEKTELPNLKKRNHKKYSLHNGNK